MPAWIRDRLKIKITKPPVDDAANNALRLFCAKIFHLPRSAVVIMRGEHHREKTLFLRGISAAELLSRLSFYPVAKTLGK